MIPKNITKIHIIQALTEIDRHDVPLGRESRVYDLVYHDKRYPPKYVISLANLFANGVELDSGLFITTMARTFLEQLGFTVQCGNHR